MGVPPCLEFLFNQLWVFSPTGGPPSSKIYHSLYQYQYKKAIELNPQNYRAYIELGRLYMIQGKPAEAEQLYKKAIELNP